MGKPRKRWPKWRIGVMSAAFAAGAALLFWLSALAEHAVSAHGSNPSANAVLSVPSFLLAMAIGLALLGAFGFGWLTWRLYDDRIPPWKKRDRKRRW